MTAERKRIERDRHFFFQRGIRSTTGASDTSPAPSKTISSCPTRCSVWNSGPAQSRPMPACCASKTARAAAAFPSSRRLRTASARARTQSRNMCASSASDVSSRPSRPACEIISVVTGTVRCSISSVRSRRRSIISGSFSVIATR